MEADLVPPRMGQALTPVATLIVEAMAQVPTAAACMGAAYTAKVLDHTAQCTTQGLGTGMEGSMGAHMEAMGVECMGKAMEVVCIEEAVCMEVGACTERQPCRHMATVECIVGQLGHRQGSHHPIRDIVVSGKCSWT
jgi:hypothetical protein